MADLITAIGLALVIEGVIFALFPEGVKKLMMQVLAETPARLRWAGIFAVALGCGLVWIVRG